MQPENSSLSQPLEICKSGKTRFQAAVLGMVLPGGRDWTRQPLRALLTPGWRLSFLLPAASASSELSVVTFSEWGAVTKVWLGWGPWAGSLEWVPEPIRSQWSFCLVGLASGRAQPLGKPVPLLWSCGCTARWLRLLLGRSNGAGYGAVSWGSGRKDTYPLSSSGFEGSSTSWSWTLGFFLIAPL